MKRCPKCGKSYPDEANFCPTDAGRLVSVAESAGQSRANSPTTPGLVGGRFQLGAIVGGTHTGEVHRAADTQSGGSVAIKLVAPEVMAIPAVAQRIERELKQLERVQHKAVARVLASGKYGDRVFFATELVEGARPLSELVAASGPIDPQRASDLVLAIGEALIEAAKVGVVHRDLSPKNVLVTQDSLRVINFCVPTPPMVEKSLAAGVAEFVAPESIEGKPVDQRSNIYSLASIHYFLLTGRAPHTGEPAQVLAAHLAGVVEPPSKHAAVPADVDALVVRALERNAAKRYLTLRQFLDEVERVSRGPEGGLGKTAPFGKAGKSRELSSTLMGFGGGTTGSAMVKAVNEARTKQMNVEVPPEAMREAGALDAAVADQMQRQTALHGASAQESAAAVPPSSSAAQAPLQAAPAPVLQAAPIVSPGAPAQGGNASQGGIAAAQAPTVAGVESPWARSAMGAIPGGSPAPHEPFAPAAAAMQQAAPAMGAAAGGAQPAHEPFAPAAAAMQQAAPAMGATARAAGPSGQSGPGGSNGPSSAAIAATAPAPAGPAVAPPRSGGAPAGKKKGEEKERVKQSKGKFRETMWFKKGQLDAEAADQAAAANDPNATGKADLLPIEERYTDDGSITTSDADQFSLKTGGTQTMRAMRDDDGGAGASVSERELVGEMKGGRNVIIGVLVVAALIIGGIVVAFVV